MLMLSSVLIHITRCSRSWPLSRDYISPWTTVAGRLLLLVLPSCGQPLGSPSLSFSKGKPRNSSTDLPTDSSDIRHGFQNRARPHPMKSLPHTCRPFARAGPDDTIRSSPFRQDGTASLRAGVAPLHDARRSSRSLIPR